MPSMSSTPIDCPKCGGYLVGPRYQSGWGCSCHPESLAYTCDRCGYVVTTPTKEQEAARGAVDHS